MTFADALVSSVNSVEDAQSHRSWDDYSAPTHEQFTLY